MASTEITDAEKAEKLRLYSEVVEQARLGDVKLVGSKFRVDPSFVTAPEEDRKFGYDIDVFDPIFDSEAGVAAIRIKFAAYSKVGRKKAMSLVSDYIIIYDGLDGCQEEQVLVFLGKVGVFAGYPYFRSLLSQHSWAARIEIPILPVLKA